MWSMWKEWVQTRVNLDWSKSNWMILWPTGLLTARISRLNQSGRNSGSEMLGFRLFDCRPFFGCYTAPLSWSATAVPRNFNFILHRNVYGLFKVLDCSRTLESFMRTVWPHLIHSMQSRSAADRRLIIKSLGQNRCSQHLIGSTNTLSLLIRFSSCFSSFSVTITHSVADLSMCLAHYNRFWVFPCVAVQTVYHLKCNHLEYRRALIPFSPLISCWTHEVWMHV